MMTRSSIVIIVLLAFVGLAAAESPFKKISANRWVHKPSGIVLPNQIAKFQRAGWKVYGSEGRDAGAEYNLDLLIRGDVYIYPVGTYGNDLESEFRFQQNQIRTINKRVKLVAERKFFLQQGGRSIGGLHADYQLTRGLFATSNRRCGSQFYVFQDGDWFLACRFSYPLEKSDIARNHIAEFLREWRWRSG